MTQLAKETGLGCESLYKALSGEGGFATILKVTNALGIGCMRKALRWGDMNNCDADPISKEADHAMM